MKMSHQMIGCVMFALQNSLLEQSDILGVFEDWNLFLKDGDIFVENPPNVRKMPEDDEIDDEEDILDFITSEKKE